MRIAIEMRSVLLSLGAAWLAVMLAGCSTQGYSVIAATGTTIGVGISQNPTSGVVDATLGYKRAELAFVPTNRNGGKKAGDHFEGARDSANVIMELQYRGIFSFSADSGIYQRLAVGDIAVAQPGAAIIFAKGPDGKIDSQALKALQAVKGISPVDESIEKEKAKLSKKYLEYKQQNNAAELQKFDTAAKAAGYDSFESFSVSLTVTAEKIKLIREKLKEAGIQLEN